MEIFLTGQSQKFIGDMRESMQSNNLFPPATATSERIEYLFRHRRTGIEASLSVEDQPGSESIRRQLRRTA